MNSPVIGILMLKTRFPRIVGDIGNPQTWPFPVCYEVVQPATVERVVNSAIPDDLLQAFITGGERLAKAGAQAITTSCGFLAPFQAELSRSLPVPVITSSLLQIPLVEAMLPHGKRVGVITIDSSQLTPAHLAAAGARADTPLCGTERGQELTRMIREDLGELDAAAAEADVLAAGDALHAKTPELGAVVLECTNMAPYSAALRRHLSLPVYDIVSLIGWLYAGLRGQD